jgi:hypothetical protein
MRQRKKRIGLKKHFFENKGEKLEFKNPKKSLLIVHFPRGRVTQDGAAQFVETLMKLLGIKVKGTFQDGETIRYTGIEVG